jgi:predicted nuclease of predicted toxin-antitoxin system
MKLLLDENIPPTLAKALSSVYPGSAHVHHCGLGAADDGLIWARAKEHGYVIVTKDADYEEFSMLKGAPPKVIWLRTGNCTTQHLEKLMRQREAEIERFLASETDAILEIRPDGQP